MSPALAGGFSTTAPPGKSVPHFLRRTKVFCHTACHVVVLFVCVFLLCFKVLHEHYNAVKPAVLQKLVFTVASKSFCSLN